MTGSKAVTESGKMSDEEYAAAVRKLYAEQCDTAAARVESGDIEPQLYAIIVQSWEDIVIGALRKRFTVSKQEAYSILLGGKVV